MKSIERMTGEEILEEALGGIPEYLADIGRCGRFSTEDCLSRCIARVKDLYKRSIRPVDWSIHPSTNRALTAGQVAELTRICITLDGPLRERIASAQERHAKEKAVYQINSTAAQALITSALREVGVESWVVGQKYRARAHVTLPRDGHLRFYIRYKDLQKEGAVDGVAKAVAALRDALADPGGSVTIK